MEKSKIKILVVPSDRQGVGHFRSIWAAKRLKKNRREDFDITIDATPNFTNLNYLTSFDIIHFHRQLGPYESSSELFPKLQAAGVLLVMDIDDYWSPPPTHPLYDLIKKEGISEKIEKNLSLVDWVTTTTDIFAKRIEKINSNVFVIPNAVQADSKQWRSGAVPAPEGKTRVAWIGGSSHLYDLYLLKDSMKLLADDDELRKKTQIVMCGFDIRGDVTEYDAHGNPHKRPIKPHETIWIQFERIFTYDYYLLRDDPQYVKWLKKIQKEGYPDMYHEDYVRRWTQKLNSYAEHYDYCDICLAPLVETYDQQVGKGPKTKIVKRPHVFNEVKSELKVIEAGVKKKTLVAQDYAIYKDKIIDGETGILVKHNKKGWYNAIKELVDNPGYREDLANNLHEWVKEEYSIDRINGLRGDFYKQIYQEQKQKEKIVV